MRMPWLDDAHYQAPVIPVHPSPANGDGTDPLASARGLMLGVLYSLAIWVPLLVYLASGR